MNKSKIRIYLPLITIVPAVVLYFYLERMAGWFIFTILSMPKGSRMAEAIRFFIYEAPKVLLLLTVIVFAVGVIRSFFSPEKTRKALMGKPLFVGSVFAAFLGIVTPFCSCSAVPLFIGFVEGGIPLGVTFSFLVAAPMINEVALVLLLDLFGWKTAVLYAITGLSIAIISGWIMGRLRVERFVEPWVYDVRVGSGGADAVAPSLESRVRFGYQAVAEIVSRVWKYVLIGIGVGALIHGYVPENFMASFMGKSAWWSVPAAVILGVPMYSNAAGVIPVMQALLEKGASLGTTLAFVMAVIGLSFPEMIILRKVLRIPLMVIFAGIVAFGIIVVGYLFNAVF
jgi:uncharacterized membrane protein YraQ (UPF0718 family)